MFRLILAWGVMGFLATAGCNQKNTPPKPNAPKASSEDEHQHGNVTLDEVKKEVGEAGEKSARFAGQEKDKFVKTVREKIDGLRRKIDELKEKGKDLSGEAREKWQKTLEDLKQKQEDARQKLEKLQSAGGEAWQEMQQGVDAAWNDLQDACQNAAEELKK
ncbi:MAG: hypothetical protein JXB10_05075 [Pirellulales bacterium]|nr:hypothetical protein [Pirellulales bacterium]